MHHGFEWRADSIRFSGARAGVNAGLSGEVAKEVRSTEIRNNPKARAPLNAY